MSTGGHTQSPSRTTDTSAADPATTRPPMHGQRGHGAGVHHQDDQAGRGHTMGDDDCCGGWTLDVTVGEVNVTLHSHAFLAPDVLDTLLTRITARAAAADVARTRALCALADRITPTPITDQQQ